MENANNYETASDREKWNVLAMVANLYYNSELTQNQIADRLYTSRSKVSRMLKEARQLGIVEIYIREPWERNAQYEEEIKSKFNLKNVRVVALKDIEECDIHRKLGEAAAYYLDSVIKRKMTLGISWGNTLYHIVKYIAINNRKNIPITVVPIMGAANIKSPEKDALDLAKNLASAYGGKYHYLYAPLFVNNKELRESLVQEENISNVLEISRNADVILTSVGSITYKTWSNYLSVNILENLEKKGAVGHIGGNFFDINGNEVENPLAERMIGVNLADLKKCPEVICVARGENKSEAILGALRGGFIDTLIIDEECAKKIISDNI